jgi:hypothetical protein
MDMALKFAPEDEQQRQWACERYAVARQAQQAGQYEGGLKGPGAGIGYKLMGDLATLAPDAPTPLLPLPLTNRQVALTAGAATFTLFEPLQAAVPAYHFAAGQFGAYGVPAGLTQTRERFLFHLLSQARPFQSFNEVVEGESLQCGQEDLPYDDHLSQVEVPVLYVGAAGGYGRYGVYGTTLLGSRDVTVHMVQHLPEPGRVLDFGHADLFLADSAPEAVWAPLFQWLERH